MIQESTFRNWYDDAKWALLDLAHRRDWNPDTLINLVALYSPQCTVAACINRAVYFLEQGRHRSDVYYSQKRAVDNWLETGRYGRRASKTRNFAAALSGDPDAVVIDVWVCRYFGVPETYPRSVKRYRVLANKIRRNARRHKMTPVEYQAAIWEIAYRRGYEQPRPPTISSVVRSQGHV